MLAEAEQIDDKWHVENKYNDNWCVSKKVWLMMLICGYMNKKAMEAWKFEKVEEEESIFMCAPDIPERGVSSFWTHQQGIGEGYLYKEKDSKDAW